MGGKASAVVIVQLCLKLRPLLFSAGGLRRLGKWSMTTGIDMKHGFSQGLRARRQGTGMRRMQSWAVCTTSISIPGPSFIVLAGCRGDDAPPEGRPDTFDRTEVLEQCIGSRRHDDADMDVQTSIDKDVLPGGDGDSPHVKANCKGINKYRFTVKGPASCRSGCCRGT